MGARRDSNDKEKDVLKFKKKGNPTLVDKLKMKAGGSKNLLKPSKQVKKRRTSANSSTISEKDKSQSKTPLKPEASRPSTSAAAAAGGAKSSGCIQNPHHKVSKSNRSRRPGRPHRRIGSDDESGSETDHEGGLTPESAEQVYSVTYLEDYFDSIESMDGAARFTSRITQNNCDVLGLLNELDSAFQQLLGNDEDELDLNNLSQEQKNALFNMGNLLIETNCSGDLNTRLSEDVANFFDKKLQLLKIDEENLDRVLGKADNKAPKKGASTLKKVSINPEPLKPTSFRSLGSIFDPGSANPMLGSPTPNVSSVSAGDVFNFDESLLEGCTRYRTCKFRNPPQYVPTTRQIKTQPPLSQEKTSTTEEKVESSKKEGGTQLKKCSSSTSVRSGNSGAKRTSAAAAVLDTSTASVEENSSSEEEEPTYCLCEKESSGKMVGCDNHLCPIEWFHFKCVALKSKPKGKWFCPKCRGDDFTVMKPKKIFLAELELYNKEKEKDF